MLRAKHRRGLVHDALFLLNFALLDQPVHLGAPLPEEPMYFSGLRMWWVGDRGSQGDVAAYFLSAWWKTFSTKTEIRTKSFGRFVLRRGLRMRVSTTVSRHHRSYGAEVRSNCGSSCKVCLPYGKLCILSSLSVSLALVSCCGLSVPMTFRPLRDWESSRTHTHTHAVHPGCLAPTP